jgi:hypothetical protein
MSRPAAFRETVNLGGEPCRWTRHFQPGCARSVIGYLQKLSENDPERFCWASFGDIAKHAKNWKADPSGGLVYSERQVRRVLRLVEQLGILLPMTRKRNGRKRSGWIVPRHDTPPEWKYCTVPSIGLTYRSTPKAKKISTANVSCGKGFLSGGKGIVSAKVSGLEGFVSALSAESVRDCVRPDESQVPKMQPVDADGQRVLPPVSRGLTFNEPSKPIFSASEERSRKEVEPATRSDPAIVSPEQNLKAEGPERAKAKASFEVKPEIQKAEQIDEPPKEFYEKLQRWKVPFEADAVRTLWRVCRLELPSVTVPFLMWNLELAWDRADREKIKRPVGFLIQACWDACHHEALHPTKAPRKDNFSSVGDVLQKIMPRT